MLEVEGKRAACDWPRCQRGISLSTKTYREQLKELRSHGWRASENLGTYCICKFHNESKEWE